MSEPLFVVYLIVCYGVCIFQLKMSCVIGCRLNVARYFCVYLTGDSRATPCFDEYSCLAARLSETERLNLEAIRTLHSKLDDDANGNIDLSESDEVR